MARSVVRLLLVTLLAAGTLLVGASPAPAGSTGCPCAVTNNNDSGPGSFRQAVEDASLDADGNNVITFDPGLHVELTLPGPEFTGTQGLTIIGNGSIVDGNESVQIFKSAATVLVTFSGIELRNGDSGGVGAAIRTANGPIRVENSVLRGHSAINGGGAIGATGTGAITVEDTEILTSATSAGSGGAIGAGNSVVTVTDSRLAGNQAGGVGGAISAASVRLVDTTFNGNSSADVSGGGAVHAGGEIEVINGTFIQNTASGGGGGALRTPAGPVSVIHGTFTANSAPSGAHLLTNGAVTLFGVTLSDPQGGGGNCAIPIGPTTSYTRSSDDTCDLDGSGDVENAADPRLGPLRDNGGGLYTLYPLWASPLVDAIPVADCDADVNSDARGVTRPFEAGCDIGAVEQAYPTHDFTDSAAWVEGAIRWITSPVNAPEPIMTGISPTTFKPNDNITRAQVTRLLYREAGSPDTGSYPPHGFTDVPAWVDQAVTWAKAENIMTGITATLFKPNDPITRAQVVRAKYRLAGEPDVSALPAHPFTDVPAWVTDAVRWASANTLVTGITPTLFKPNDPITRGQVARTDYRLAINPDAWDDPDSAPLTLPFRPVP